MPKHMGKITEVQWKEFVQQKTNPKALTISNEYAEMSKKKLSVRVTLIRLKTLKKEPWTGYSLGWSWLKTANLSTRRKELQ
jgi:hypothetical protein